MLLPSAAAIMPIAGVFAWMDRLAAQLVDPLAAAGMQEEIRQLLMVWGYLSDRWAEKTCAAPSALILLQPGVVRLIQTMAMQPAPPPAAAASFQRMQGVLINCLGSLTFWCGGLLEHAWTQQQQRWASDMAAPRPRRVSFQDDIPSAELLEAVLGQEVSGTGLLAAPPCFAMFLGLHHFHPCLHRGWCRMVCAPV
jgi:hypothetical protein